MFYKALQYVTTCMVCFSIVVHTQYKIQHSSTSHRQEHSTWFFQKVFQLCAWHSSSLSYKVCHTYCTVLQLWAEQGWHFLRHLLCWWMQWWFTKQCLTEWKHLTLNGTLSQACGHNIVTVFIFQFLVCTSAIKEESPYNTWLCLSMAKKRSPLALRLIQ